MAKKKANEDAGGYAPTKGEAFIEGGIQGGSFGFADEVGALAGLAPYHIDSMGNVTKEYADNETPDFKELARRYVSKRDLNRAKEQELLEQQPGAYVSGNIAGGLATSLATPIGPVADVAINALGASEADLTEGDILGAGKDVARDAALAGLLNAGVQGAKLASKSNLGRRAKAITGERLASLRASARPTMNKIEDTLGRGKQKLEDLVNKDSAGNIELDDIAGRLRREPTEAIESQVERELPRFEPVVEEGISPTFDWQKHLEDKTTPNYRFDDLKKALKSRKDAA